MLPPQAIGHVDAEQVTPYANVRKLGTVGLVGYVIALTTVGPHRLTGFGVSRHPSWVPSIDKPHRAYYIAVPANAGTHNNINVPMSLFKNITNESEVCVA